MVLAHFAEGFRAWQCLLHESGAAAGHPTAPLWMPAERALARTCLARVVGQESENGRKLRPGLHKDR